jgi:hypothetical protein
MPLAWFHPVFGRRTEHLLGPYLARRTADYFFNPAQNRFKRSRPLAMISSEVA